MAKIAPVNAMAGGPKADLLRRDYKTVPEKCLSICEPWAWACVVPFKPIENRNWSSNFRGRIAIHSSSSARHMTIENQEFFKNSGEKLAALFSHEWIVAGTHELFNFGAIIGTVELLGCVDLRSEDINGEDEFRALMRERFGTWYDRHLALHDIPPERWAEGQVLWIFDHAVQFARPIQAKGALNLWALSPDQQSQIAKELAYSQANPPIDGLIASDRIVG